MAVALLVVGMVLWVCPWDPLAFRWGLGVGHRLQPWGLYGLVDNGGGLGTWLDSDRGRGVPRSRVGLAGGGGCLLRVDNGALGDGDVDEGLDGVGLCGRLHGGDSCWGEGGLRCVRAGSWLGFGLGFGLGRGRFCCRFAFCDFGALLGGAGGVGVVVDVCGAGGAVAGGIVVWVPVLIWGRVFGLGPVRG